MNSHIFDRLACRLPGCLVCTEKADSYRTHVMLLQCCRQGGPPEGTLRLHRAAASPEERNANESRAVLSQTRCVKVGAGRQCGGRTEPGQPAAAQAPWRRGGADAGAGPGVEWVQARAWSAPPPPRLSCAAAATDCRRRPPCPAPHGLRLAPSLDRPEHRPPRRFKLRLLRALVTL